MNISEEGKHYYQTSPEAAANVAMKEQLSSQMQFNPEIPSVVPGSRIQLSGESVGADADEVLLWLARYGVERNHPRRISGSIPVDRSGEVMVFNTKDKLNEAFTKLIVEGFSSSPVLDNNLRYVCFLDLLDFAWFVVRGFGEWSQQQGFGASDETSLMADQWAKYRLTDAFKNATVADVIQRPAWQQRTAFNPVYPGFSTLYAQEFMARTGTHRVPVLNKNHKVQNILTQSMVISLYSQNMNRFGTIRNIKVSNMLSGLVPDVQTVLETDSALSAFRKMVNKNISGLAVLDNRGVLVDNISIRDLRGIGIQADKYERLWLSVKQFKELARNEFAQQTPSKLITVDANSTFADVINAMDDGNIHRVFVVDNQMAGTKVTHVISQRDVIRFVLYRMAMSPQTVQEAEE